jgi:glycosyltransferase involved in cell wall biosynthesis
MKVLIIDDILPDPGFGAGFPRAYQMLLALSSLGHEIQFYQTYPERFKLATRINKKALKDRQITINDELPLEPPDRVIISRPHNMFFYKDIIREFFPNTKLIYDMEALWYRRFELQQQITGERPEWTEAYIKYDELKMAKEADSCIIVNEQEKNILLDDGIKEVHILGHTVKRNRNGKTFKDRDNFLIVGGDLNQGTPNEDSTHWFIQNCWPKINKSTLVVTGVNKSDRLKQLEEKDVEFIGYATNLSDYYQACKVHVTGTRFATGIPLKVIEAMANGIPCVISSLLGDQLGIKNEALVAKNEDDFISSCNNLYNDENLWNTTRNNAFGLIEQKFNLENFTKKTEEILA